MKFNFKRVFPCMGKHFMIFVMRTIIFLFCSTVLGFMPKEALGQNNKVKIDANKVVTVDEVFDLIMEQTDYSFVYEEGIFGDLPEVHLKKGSVRTFKLLRESLDKGDYTIIVTANNGIVIKEVAKSMKRLQKQISGKVTDETGVPLAGVTVLIKGTTRGVVTDFDGNYSIGVPDPAHVLLFSSLGYEAQEILVGNKTSINVILKESVSQMDEVVLKGYYKTSKIFDTGSVDGIKSKTIEKQPVSNPLAAMQGYIPGVNITQDSGVPGGGFNIEIRGKNFLGAGTNPLYIVDGVPYSSEALGQSVEEGSIADSFFPFGNISPLNLINPSDIASIEVLKDADATAIYGSRGANGVVLITTKKGKVGKTQIRVNISTGLASIPRSSFVDLLNTEQYLEMRREALVNDGLWPLNENDPDVQLSYPDLLLWDQERYTDWQEVLIGNTAYRNTAQLSISGGNEQTQFLVSGNYQKETTVYIGNSNYRKASVQSNINHQSTDKHFHINVSTNYTVDDNQLPRGRFARLAYILPPNAPALYEENGDLNWENSTWTNPLNELEGELRIQSSNLLLNSVISYKTVSDLELKVNMGYAGTRTEQYRTFPHTRLDPALGFTSIDGSIVSTNEASNISWIIEPQINWKQSFGDLSIELLLGTTFQQRLSKQIRHLGAGFPSNSQILDLTAATSATIQLNEESDYKYNAIFGRLNFKLLDKYIMNLTGRRDGSSRFGPGKQFGNFGAIGMAWLFSEESFLKNNNLLSFGKLRSSYGITGSDNVVNYGFFNSYETSEENYDGSGIEPSRLFNPNFAWEENKKFEVALELGFFNNRTQLTTAWFRNRSSNQLVGIPLPDTAGFNVINANFDATVDNTGLEIDFRSVNIQNNHFKWTTTFNISIPKNKLVKFDGLESSTFADRYVVGEPLSISKLFHITGVNPDTGVYQYEDYNNDGIISLASSPLDRQFIQHTAPEFYGGFGNIINYKGWTLDMFFQFKKHDAKEELSVAGAPGGLQNQLKSVLSRWQQPGDNTSIQRYTTTFFSAAGAAYNNFYASNRIYSDASFIRLRNIALTYNFPKDNILGIDASIYLQGQNLLTLTKFKGPDPDSSFAGGWLPPLQQFTLGIQLGF